METLEIRSTSARTAEASPIALRETDQVRLVFLPTLVDNKENRRASVKGAFVYQRKGKNDEWTPLNTESLASVKKGESFKLELHSTELLALGDGLRPLYEFQRDQDPPRGRHTFVKLEASLARFFALGEADLRTFLDAHPQDALTTLLKIVRWVATTIDSSEAARNLAALSPGDLPAVSSLLGLAAMQRAIGEWERNRTNDSEEYWQTLLAGHSAVLSQIFAYPIVMIAEKAYVGGKQLDNTGGKVVDFIARAVATRAVVSTAMESILSPRNLEAQSLR